MEVISGKTVVFVCVWNVVYIYNIYIYIYMFINFILEKNSRSQNRLNVIEIYYKMKTLIVAFMLLFIYSLQSGMTYLVLGQ